ncbi:MAG TPA: hypothetical protein VK731_03755, partial [Candidatus Cybelea sp.]|nr:hypothetical protein [Candidatus Cybelea sp.]
RIFVAIDAQLVGSGFNFKVGQTCHLRKTNQKWMQVDSSDDGLLAKRHGLQGPIDDAFMDSFIMVRPNGNPQNKAVGEWTHSEMTNAITQWRLQFRGEPRVKDDTAITDADIASNNLVLWGDPDSNRLLAKIAAKLPIHWNRTSVRFGEKTFPADQFVPVMIYPNPLNPKRYVVLNSGFTFSEVAHLSNALQTPKLPDYAVLDISTPRSARPMSGVVDAGFFDEHWQLPASQEK